MKFRTIVTFVLAACLCLGLAAPALADGDPLSLWADGTAKTALIEYVTAVTDPDSPDFIPVEDRIVVSAMDGTVFCETDPVYFDHLIYQYRVTEDPDYKDKASDYEKAVAVRVQEFIDTGVQPADLDNAMGAAMASAFAGMTLNEFYDYVKEYKQRPMASYEGMTLGGVLLDAAGVRAECDERNEKIGKKIREATLEKVPYMLVIGDRDVENATVSVRTRSGEDRGAMALEAFIAQITEEIRSRSR